MALSDKVPSKRAPIAHTFCQSPSPKACAAAMINNTARNSSCAYIWKIRLGQDVQDLCGPTGTIPSLILGPLAFRLHRDPTAIFHRSPFTSLGGSPIDLKPRMLPGLGLLLPLPLALGEVEGHLQVRDPGSPALQPYGWRQGGLREEPEAAKLAFPACFVHVAVLGLEVATQPLDCVKDDLIGVIFAVDQSGPKATPIESLGAQGTTNMLRQDTPELFETLHRSRGHRK